MAAEGESRYHILTLHVGDRFRFVAGGPVFIVDAESPELLVRAEALAGASARPHRMARAGLAFVYVEPEPDDEGDETP